MELSPMVWIIIVSSVVGFWCQYYKAFVYLHEC
jgi:hypothetical protein